jgi:hypothetical protein
MECIDVEEMLRFVFIADIHLLVFFNLTLDNHMFHLKWTELFPFDLSPSY